MVASCFCKQWEALQARSRSKYNRLYFRVQTIVNAKIFSGFVHEQRLPGRTAAPPASAISSRSKASKPKSARRSACRSTHTSRQPGSAGFTTTSKAPAKKAKQGRLAFGTVDSWLVWNFTKGSPAHHRRDERLAHHALQHPHVEVGRRTARSARYSAQHAA